MQKSVYTYDDGRRCKHCGKAIADQVHDGREFCPPKLEDDGTVTNCKDDYHNEQRQKSDPPYRAHMALQKEMTKAIQTLLEERGPLVSLEQVNRRGIQLPRAVEISFRGGLPRFSFVWHTLELLSDFTIQIHTHEHALL